MSKLSEIRDFKIEWKHSTRGRLCRFTIAPKPEYASMYAPGENASTRWKLPAYSKSGRFDRHFLIQTLKELYDVWDCPIMGTKSPGGLNFTKLSPTTGAINFKTMVLLHAHGCDHEN